jgi:hypothetical protein
VRAVSLACGLVGVSLLLVLPAVWGLESESEQAFATIALERLAIEETPKSLNAYQFLRADTKGHVYLLKGDTLQVDELLPTGKLVARGKPVAGGGKASDSPAFTDAMLSPDGSSWLLASRPERLALLNSDGLRDLPSVPWLLSAVVYGMDGPIVSVIPSRTGTENASAPPAGKDWNRPPLLLELKDQEWKTLVAAEPFVARDQRPLKIQEMKAERDTRLAVDARGTLWVAQQDAYLLRHYSRSGILLDSLRAGDGRVQ